MIARPFLAAGLLAALTAPPALALTPDELWQAAQARWAALGVVLEAEAVHEGDVLHLRGAQASLVLPLGAGVLTAAPDDIALTGQADGTVAVTLAPGFSIGLQARLVDGAREDRVFARLDITAPGLAILAQGTAADLTITTTSPQLDLTLDGVRLDPPMEGVDLFAWVGLSTLASQMHLTLVEGGIATQISGSADRLVLDLQDTLDGLQNLSVYEVRGLTWTRQTDLPAGPPPDLSDLGPALRAGLAFAATAEAAGARSETVTRQGDTILSRQTTRDAGSTLALTLDRGGVQVSSRAVGNQFGFMETTLSPETIQVPVDEAWMELAVPLLAGPTPQEARLRLGLTGVDPSAAMEAALGPGAGAVSTEPARLALDLTALLTLRADLTDLVAQVGGLEGGPIVTELNALRLAEAALSWAGASAVLSGEASLDWTDRASPDDPPWVSAVGRSHVTGVNGLLRRLSETGLVTPDVMLGLRAALAMAGRPVGPDELAGELTYSPDDGLRLNGMSLDGAFPF